MRTVLQLWKKLTDSPIFTGCVCALLLFLQHLQLAYEDGIPIKTVLSISFLNTLVNLLVTALLFLMLLVLTGRLRYAALCSCVLVTALSCTTHYVTIFHGSPPFWADMLSLKTGLNVMGEYTFRIDHVVTRILLMALLQLIIMGVSGFFRKPSQKKHRPAAAAVLAADLAALYVLFFSAVAPYSGSLVAWSWVPAAGEYGYELLFVNSIACGLEACSSPEGYRADLVKTVEASPASVDRYPDIILIINESLYDLNRYAEVPEAAEIMERFTAIEGVRIGEALVSGVGSGTNNTEYEVLTSNSMVLMNSWAPFTFLNMKGADSAVSYLHSLGYSTAAMHDCDETNYNRNRAYAAMEFDIIDLGDYVFKYQESNGNRRRTDHANYLELLEIWNSQGEGPRFTYLLTIQNHGGYEQNPDDFDTVRVAGNFGDYTDDVNEYLSSVSLSVDAFAELTEAFTFSERNVIVVMVGDHAPPFLNALEPREGLENSWYEQRLTPYFVWSNCGTDLSTIPSTLTLVDLLPAAFRAAGMPLTEYYSTILALNDLAPLRAANGWYLDANGCAGTAGDGTETGNAFQNYLYMEYNAVKGGSDYRPDWFRVMKETG